MPYLERAYNRRNPWLLNVQVDPAMDDLRSSPRFRDLIRRIGLPLPPIDEIKESRSDSRRCLRRYGPLKRE